MIIDFLGTAETTIPGDDAATVNFRKTIALENGGFATASVNIANEVVIRFSGTNESPSSTGIATIDLNRDGHRLQGDFDVLGLPDGGFFIVWSEFVEDPFRLFQTVVGQRVDAQGVPIGNVLTLFAPSPMENLDYRGPVATVLSNGNIVVVADSIQVIFDGSPFPAEQLRIFRPDGTLVLERQVGEEDRDIFAQDIIGLRNGGFAAITFGGVGGASFDLRLFDSDGQPNGAPVRVQQDGGFFDGDMSLVELAGGNIAVVWDSESLPSSGDTSDGVILGRVFSASGQPITDQFRVNTSTFGWQENPHMVALPTGEFFVVWFDPDGLRFDPEPAIKGQLFSALGATLGPEQVVLEWREPEALGGDIGPRLDGLSLLNDGTLLLEIIDQDVDQNAHQVVPFGINVPEPEQPGVITGTNGDDMLNGADGDDQIAAGAGNDTLDGGAGDDRISSSDGNDLAIGGAGNDNIGGGLGDDTLDGGDGDDILGGGFGADSVTGGAGNDVVAGGAGDDTLEGGEGNDSMSGSFGNDLIDGGEGADDIGGGTGRDTIDAGAGNDSVGGGEGDDSILGGEGNDFLAGGGRNDTIDGGAGNDTINAGAGNDVITGGTGADQFVFSAFFDGEADVITDFEDGLDSFFIRRFDPDTGVENINNGGNGLAGFVTAMNIVDVAGGAQMTVNGNTILVEGVTAAQLTVDDFTFL